MSLEAKIALTKDQNVAAVLVFMLCFKTTGKIKPVPLTLLQMAAGDERVPGLHYIGAFEPF